MLNLEAEYTQRTPITLDIILQSDPLVESIHRTQARVQEKDIYAVVSRPTKKIAQGHPSNTRFHRCMFTAS